MKPFLLVAFLFSFLVGCSSVTAHKNPAVDLGKFKCYYVEHRLTDDRKIDELIVADLRRRGLEASFGPITMMPENAEALITYEDRWTWDFHNYLIELSINVRDIRKEKPIAMGHTRHPGPFSKEPAEMIGKVLDSIFKP